MHLHKPRLELVPPQALLNVVAAKLKVVLRSKVRASHPSRLASLVYRGSFTSQGLVHSEMRRAEARRIGNEALARLQLARQLAK